MKKLFTIILPTLILMISGVLNAQENERYLEQPIPESWAIDTMYRPDIDIDTSWWKKFDDPLLDSLIGVALSRNYSLSSSWQKINQAKASYRQALSGFYPSIDLSAQWLREQNSLNTSSVTESDAYRMTQYQNVALSGQWEVDIFGNVRKIAKAQKRIYQATESDYYAAILSLCSSVASTYINLRSYQQLYKVAEQNIASQKIILDLTVARYNAGLAAQLDVSQAKSVYYSTLASLPSLKSSIDNEVNSMAVLLGVYPSDIKARLEEMAPLPSSVHIVNVGIPANIIRRRPDVHAAELTVESYAAALGASRANYYPKFYLSGSFGYLSHDWDKLFDEKSQMFEINPSMKWTLFSGMEIRQATVLAKSQLEESINTYNETVLTAIQQVESVMTSYSNALNSIVAMQQVVSQGQKTLELSVDLYKRGLGTFMSVLDAQQSLLSYQKSLVSVESDALLSLVQLYVALGGGY